LPIAAAFAVVGVGLLGANAATAAGGSIQNPTFSQGKGTNTYVVGFTMQTDPGLYVKTIGFQPPGLNATILQPTLSAGGSTSTCVVDTGGTAAGTTCSVEANRVTNGTSVVISFKTQSALPQGQGYIWGQLSNNQGFSARVSGPTGQQTGGGGPTGGGPTVQLVDVTRNLLSKKGVLKTSFGPPPRVWTGVTLRARSQGSWSLYGPGQHCVGSPDVVQQLFGGSTDPEAFWFTGRPLLPMPGLNYALYGGACLTADVQFPSPHVDPSVSHCTDSTGAPVSTGGVTNLKIKVWPTRVLDGGTIYIDLCTDRPTAQAFDNAQQKDAVLKFRGRTVNVPLNKTDFAAYQAQMPTGILSGTRFLAATACTVLAVPMQIGTLARTAQGKLVFVSAFSYVQVIRLGANCPNAGAGAAYRPRCSRVGAVTFVALPNTVQSPGATDLLLPCTTPVADSFAGPAWKPLSVWMYDVVSYHNLVYNNGRLVPGAFPVSPPRQLVWTAFGARDLYVTIPPGLSPTRYIIVIRTATADVPEDSETTLR
jgi:hypothetical protein